MRNLNGKKEEEKHKLLREHEVLVLVAVLVFGILIGKYVFGGSSNAPACSDGKDNDGDGKIDYPADPGCSSKNDKSELNPSVECDNGIDDDRDGLADYPKDPGCSSLADKSERGIIQCDDGLDNDADGKIDYPNDLGCTSPSDNDETNCGDGICSINEAYATCPADCPHPPTNSPSQMLNLKRTFTFSSPYYTSLSTSEVDLNHDGKKEFVVEELNGQADGVKDWATDRGYNQYGIYEYNNNQPVRIGEIKKMGDSPGYLDLNVLDFGDTDNDGKTDMLTDVGDGRKAPDGSWSYNYYVILYESNSTSSYPGNEVFRIPTSFYTRISIISNDLDNDGKKEILVRDSTGPQSLTNNFIDMYEMNGDNSYSKVFTLPLTLQQPAVYKIVACDDIDNDGKKEFIWTSTPDVHMLENTGDNSYSEIWSTEMHGDNGAKTNIQNAICPGDLDGNGKKDFVIGGDTIINNNYMSDFRVFESTGDNSFQETARFLFTLPPTIWYDPFVVKAVDLDGDGKKELIFNNENNTLIYKSTGEHNFGLAWSNSWFRPRTLSLRKGLILGDHDKDNKGEIMFNENQDGTVNTYVYEYCITDCGTPPACSDGKDNDGDGFVDYPTDIGCTSPQDSTETGTPQCSDGIDNDRDTYTDYPADNGCSSPNDREEWIP